MRSRWILTAALAWISLAAARLEAQEACDTCDSARREPSERGLARHGPWHEKPPGWLGVYFVEKADFGRKDDGEELWTFLDYPVILSVEPGSPADRAGIAAGDMLIALDGRDVLEGVPAFTKLLRPGVRLPVRVRRAGKTRSVTVLVEPRPHSFGISFGVPDSEHTPLERVEVPAPEPRIRLLPPPPPPYDEGASSPIAGAELVRLHGDLGDYFGVEAGLLVIRVARGTPAGRSGLRGGDVIVRADGQDITSVYGLQAAVARSTDRAVELEIVRKKEKHSLVLSW